MFWKDTIAAVRLILVHFIKMWPLVFLIQVPLLLAYQMFQDFSVSGGKTGIDSLNQRLISSGLLMMVSLWTSGAVIRLSSAKILHTSWYNSLLYALKRPFESIVAVFRVHLQTTVVSFPIVLLILFLSIKASKYSFETSFLDLLCDFGLNAFIHLSSTFIVARHFLNLPKELLDQKIWSISKKDFSLKLADVAQKELFRVLLFLAAIKIIIGFIYSKWFVQYVSFTKADLNLEVSFFSKIVQFVAFYLTEPLPSAFMFFCIGYVYLKYSKTESQELRSERGKL